MRHQRQTSFNISLLAFLAGIVFFSACSTQKDNATNRVLHNLSARYNHIYNSKVLMDRYLDDLHQQSRDHYSSILPVYLAPPPINALEQAQPLPQSPLQQVELKAQKIVGEKGLSNYVDEAYLLLGKTNFYNGNYYPAAAYFDYVKNTYKKDKNVYLQALHWQSRTSMQLQQAETRKITDTLLQAIDSAKRGKSEALATLAELSIRQKAYEDAITFLNRALKEKSSVRDRIRWHYILGQLNELQQNYQAGWKHYTKVERSNAPFEMYFNAKLSKIRVMDFLSNTPTDRKTSLLKLLKDEKNLDYADQIYFEVASDAEADSDYQEALKYYLLSVQSSQQNAVQKGTSYLSIADLQFKYLRNYLEAKLYYDSAAMTLPHSFPEYDVVRKKSENLEYLSQRYLKIAEQDTLLALASRSPEEQDQWIAAKFTTRQPSLAATAGYSGAAASGSTSSDKTSSSFYFDNRTAMSRGFSDFKKQWGNRSLEDNWRQSVKSATQNGVQQLVTVTDPISGASISLDTADLQIQIRTFKSRIPLSASQKEMSQHQVMNALFEIASFYQHVIEDITEANLTYELLLKRFPKNVHTEAAYYSLYVGYQEKDPARSAHFKELLLTEYPSSLYSRNILDPAFSTRQNALITEVNKIYNRVFSLYEEKKYEQVIPLVQETNQRFPGHHLQAQFDYLKAISIGRTSPLSKLMDALEEIPLHYPTDSLITPLVEDHLSYIRAHRSSFDQRTIALIDFDPSESRFIHQPSTTPQIAAKVNPALNVAAPVNRVTPPPITTGSAPPDTLVQPQAPRSQPVPSSPVSSVAEISYFSKEESTTYYYVISVSNVNVSLSSSRFGIGQFNRGNYSGEGLRHQLREINEDQLIYISDFKQLNEVKAYGEAIRTQLSKIMKVPATTYQSFFISKENFEKINSKETLTMYLDFYKNNY